jgi:hypothetical protein
MKTLNISVRITIMTFNEWLVDNGYVSEVSQIQYELSANEVDQLYQIWTDETGGTGYGLF